MIPVSVLLASAPADLRTQVAFNVGVAVFVLVMIVGLILMRRKPGRAGRTTARLLDPSRCSGSVSHSLDRAVTRIGRAASNDIVIPQETVSARHAEIRAEGGVFRLRDLKSGNGTYINGQRLGTEEAVLSDGDRLRFDMYEFQFQKEGEPRPAGTTMLREADPAEAATLAKPDCARHAGKVAAGRCARCQQWLCRECLGGDAPAPVCESCRRKAQ